MSAEITSTAWGLWPWSDNLLQVSGDVGRGRATECDYAEQLDRDVIRHLEAVAEAGIDYVPGDWGGGSLDYLRATVLQADGFEPDIDGAPVTRWFNNNAFFRQPKIEGPLAAAPADRDEEPQLFVEAVGPPGTYQPTLLSPYAFARLSERDADVCEAEALTYATGLYDGLLDTAKQEGVTHVLFHEPFAPYHQVDRREQVGLRHAVGSLAANHPSLEIAVYFSYGDASELVRDVAADDHVAAVGCDLTKTPLAALAPVEQRFLAGIVDGGNTLLEEDAELLARLEAVAAAVGAPEVSITHTVDLERVPQAFALQKIEQLGRVARAARGEEVSHG